MDTPPAPAPLSETETEIMRMVATGATNREIARDRGISEATVKKHLTNINAKLGTANRTEATRRALELGLVSVETPGSAGAAAPTGHRDMEAARRLAAELERTRRRSRQLTVWFAAAVGLLAVAAGVLIFTWAERSPQQPVRAVGAAATSAPAPQWLAGVNLPSPLTGPAIVGDVGDDAAYVISGRGPDGPSREVLYYQYGDLQPRWQAKAEKPTPVEEAQAVTLRGTVLVPGGCTSDGRATDIVELYDPREDRWRQAARLPAPVCGYGLVDLDGTVFLFGGRDGDDPSTARDSVWRYEPSEDTWTVYGEMPLPRSDLIAVRDGAGGRVRLLGGRDRGGRLQTSHWIFSPFDAPDARWEVDSAPPLPEPRAGLSAVGTPIGGVHVVGGGWDRALENGTIRLGPTGAWEPDAPLKGFTPQRGAAMTLKADGTAVLVGGQADGRLLDRHYVRQVVFSYYFPSRPNR